MFWPWSVGSHSTERTLNVYWEKIHRLKSLHLTAVVCFGLLVESYQGLSVGIGLLVHDELGHLVVAAVSCDMQRRQVIIGDIVHRHVVLEQELDTVKVVPLSGHVERWQAVLEWKGSGGGGKDRERKKHADAHIDRWTDRQDSKLGRDRVLQGSAKSCAEDYRSIVITRSLQQCLFRYTGGPTRSKWGATQWRQAVLERSHTRYAHNATTDLLSDLKCEEMVFIHHWGFAVCRMFSMTDIHDTIF